MQFRAYGPVPIPRDGRTTARDKDSRRTFWDSVELEEGLSGACGCYILILRNKAWYVGLAEKQSFKSECFTPHKLLLFNEAINKLEAKPSLLFLAKLTLKDRFARPSANGYPAVQKLEDMLIGLAITRNPKLLNIRGTKLLKEMIVPGVLNTKQGEARALPVQAMKRALGV